MIKSFIKSLKNAFAFGALFSFIGLTFYLNKILERPVIQPRVESEDVNVSADLYGCILNLNVKTEGRVPPTNNWSADINVAIFDGNTSMGSFNTTTDNMGDATVDLCGQGIYIQGGTYDIYVRGQSHLKRKFANISSFSTSANTIDLSTSGGELIAGETSIVYDNYINVLDISTQINKLSQVNVQNDLNRDGIVDSLDIARTILNIYTKGDCAPNDSYEICN